MWKLHVYFIVRQVCEKYVRKGNDMYSAFLDLEKAYELIEMQCGML